MCIRDSITVSAVSDLSSDHDPVLITVQPTLDTPLQPPCRIRRINWRSYQDERQRTVRPDLPVLIATPADVDRMANYLSSRCRHVRHGQAHLSRP